MTTHKTVSAGFIFLCLAFAGCNQPAEQVQTTGAAEKAAATTNASGSGCNSAEYSDENGLLLRSSYTENTGDNGYQITTTVSQHKKGVLRVVQNKPYTFNSEQNEEEEIIRLREITYYIDSVNTDSTLHTHSLRISADVYNSHEEEIICTVLLVPLPFAPKKPKVTLVKSGSAPRPAETEVTTAR